MIGIVDYGAGNLKSVRKAFAFLGLRNRVVLDSPEGFAGVDRLVLPGVGSFGYAMDRLRERGLFEPVGEWAASGRPLFGICLGLQLLVGGERRIAGRLRLRRLRGRLPEISGGQGPPDRLEQRPPPAGGPPFRRDRDGEYFYYRQQLLPSVRPGRPGRLGLRDRISGRPRGGERPGHAVSS